LFQCASKSYTRHANRLQNRKFAGCIMNCFNHLVFHVRPKRKYCKVLGFFETTTTHRKFHARKSRHSQCSWPSATLVALVCQEKSSEPNFDHERRCLTIFTFVARFGPEWRTDFWRTSVAEQKATRVCRRALRASA